MTRFVGLIGVKEDPVEIRPGIFESTITETKISGNIRIGNVRHRDSELQQDSVTANHVVSIIATEASMADYSSVVYITWQGRKWSVKSIEYIRPRINMTLGGLYNE